MPQPNKIPRPFADSGDKNSIPDSSGSIGFASWQEGFPAITSEPFASGGVAPKRADFNGVFNALSAATVWNQQGGVYAYDNTTDYEVGNISEKSGIIYICKTANGPGSAVKDPETDTSETFWGRVYPQSGTFNRMYFSQTSGSYTAPATGTYRITLKGGGGGGCFAQTNSGGCSGAEGGTIIFYETLTKSSSYAFVIGAGGTAGSVNDSTPGGNGGTSTFTIGARTYQATGGIGGNNNLTYSVVGGDGLAPTGVTAYKIRGAAGNPGTGEFATLNFTSGGTGAGSGGGTTGSYSKDGVLGGGGAGGAVRSGTPRDGTKGGAGYILIEYAG